MLQRILEFASAKKKKKKTPPENWNPVSDQK
jgi:hypothetical protein